jgi:hypothetical protein
MMGIMKFQGSLKGEKYFTISVTASFSRENMLFGIGCEMAHYRVQWQALVNVVKCLPVLNCLSDYQLLQKESAIWN